MTYEDMERFFEELMAATTEEERQAVRARWLPMLVRCLDSTNAHVKEAEKMAREAESLAKEARDGVIALKATVETLHKTPKWSEDKMGWLKANWMWVVVMLYMLQSLGVEGAFAKLVSVFGGN